ncbi:2-hydroxychromene-2-carboxylate isomerase [Lutimaribacter marinistellae]|uniref:2-hydroxychromene-2-carboxylate isomerase n=1 Tax=Lutimaribacter marinistellae TaxID=1820329 RepID=A0ABV7TM40_9RHOB
MSRIDFWYSIGSTYTFLTVMRLPRWAEDNGVEVAWMPFDVRAIMKAQQNIPFAGKPKKSAYMWRDIERRAAKYGLHAELPAPYPISDLSLANQVALLGMQDGWGEAFTQTLYRMWFNEATDAGTETALSEALFRVQQDPLPVLARARDMADALAEQTARAETLGVFGSPSFVVGGELFWGDDRLEDALSWSKVGHVT